MTGLAVLPVDSKIKRENEMLSQICFIAPPEGNSKFVSKTDSISIKDKVYLNEKLKQIGDVLDTKDGNSCRVQVIGVSSSKIKNPDELDSMVRNNYNAKFE